MISPHPRTTQIHPQTKAARILRRAALGALMLVGACVDRPSLEESPPAAAPAPVAREPGPSETHAKRRPAEGACTTRLPVYRDGREVGTVCEQEAASVGLTIVDLSDDWAPTPYREDPKLGKRGRIAHREVVVDFANERFADDRLAQRAKSDRYLELYGIFPSFAVLRGRLADEARHRCHDAVDDAALAEIELPLVPKETFVEAQAESGHRNGLRKRLEREGKRRKLGSIDALAGDKRYGPMLAQYRKLDRAERATRAMQEHLACDGLLTKDEVHGYFTQNTRWSLATYRRKQMIIADAPLDRETREALLADSRELDHRAVLRALRERVVDAAGIIADGSACAERGRILGRDLDTARFKLTDAYGKLESCAPDAVSPAIEAAAKALGWTDAAATRAFFAGRGVDFSRALRIAVLLPPKPDHLSDRMELRVEIDRGDVWYQYPWKSGGQLPQPVDRRPTLTLFAKHGEREIALVRWPTTIGGWQRESVNDSVGMKYKESYHGDFVWRDLVAAPVWMPPESTPFNEIMVPKPGGGFELKVDTMGPGYRSAYGLVMLVHHRVDAPADKDKDKDGAPTFLDQGVRSHGSVNYDSILRGFSHGCHRMFNHHALRLTSFILQHYPNERRGPDEGHVWHHRYMSKPIPSRGYRYQLEPPLPVRVLEGNIRGPVREPITVLMPLPYRKSARAPGPRAVADDF
jgi:hypothetical protein